MHPRTAAVRRVAFLATALSIFTLPASAEAGVRYRAANSLERGVVAEVNAVRRAHGLRALVQRPALVRAATSHATNMARHGYFSHSWSNGVPFSRWIRRYWPGCSRCSWSVGENLYWRHPNPTAAQVVTAWLNSPPHRHNLLKRDWQSIGVGAVLTLDPFGAYRGVPSATVVAAEFGRRSR
jgi:uncharacterized protein YkwD